MEYNQEDPAMEVEQPSEGDPMEVEGQQAVEEEMMDVEDIPVTQEDSWAVIRYENPCL